MFIGHYGPAFISKRFVKSVPLWVLFLSVQIVDVVWGILVALGIEKVRVEPGFTETSPFDLYYMPYTHSLPGAIFWAVLIGGAYYLFARRDRVGGAVIVGLASLSHWITDLLVHIPDLPLWPGGPNVGFGLWDHIEIALALEVGLLLLGLVLYLSVTKAKGIVGRVSPYLLIGFLLFLEYYSLNTTPSVDPVATGLTATITFLVITLAAAAVDLTRSNR